MLARLVSVSILAAATSAAFAQRSEFQRSLAVSDHPDVYVSTGSGDIHIAASSDEQLTIIGHVHLDWNHSGDTTERAQRVVQNPPIEQSGNTIHIGEPADRALLNHISIDYEIRAPRNAALNLRTGSGDIEINGVGRFLAATSGSGSLRAHDVHGPADLHTGSGDIELYEAGPGDVEARTGSGSLQLHGLNGRLQAHTGSGDLNADGRVQGPGDLSSGSGNVRLQLSSGTRLNLAASTGSGTVHTDIPELRSSSEDHHNLDGAVNGGGPELKLHTGSGDIEVLVQR